jgi:hypothetical protein
MASALRTINETADAEDDIAHGWLQRMGELTTRGQLIDEDDVGGVALK